MPVLMPVLVGVPELRSCFGSHRESGKCHAITMRVPYFTLSRTKNS